MDDFRKPYEYTEEKRGFILLFVIMLITIEILQAAILIVPTYFELSNKPPLGTAFLALGILYLVFNLFTAIICYKLNKKLIAVSKAFLIVRTVFLSSCLLIRFFNNVDLKNLIGFDKQYYSIFELLSTTLFFPLACLLAFSIGWYLYFIKSKRCKELIQN